MYNLPKPFIDRIRMQLKDGASSFLETYNREPVRGLRVNSMKVNSEAIRPLIEKFHLSEVSWCEYGYYYDPVTRPGKHPYHAAGLYYIQEPSAMSAAELLDPQPGELVLDLAAAPGGKSTQIAAKMKGQGLLIANEIHPGRAKILSSNIERFGITNAIVTNCTPDELAQRFPFAFDRVLLDAPCSGEGMFHKEPETIGQWSLDQVKRCAVRQADVLHQAAQMVRPGGILTYSTCTFAPEENEEQIASFLSAHPDFELLRMESIWPHQVNGEGHFVALLQNIAQNVQAASSHNRTRIRNQKSTCKKGSQPASSQQAWKCFEKWMPELAKSLSFGEPHMFGSQLYWLPSHPRVPNLANDLEGLRVLRPGLHLAEDKNNRIEPAHALALACLSRRDMLPTISFAPEQKEITAFLHGECLTSPGEDGWVVLCVDDFPLGWGKRTGNLLKNHYPKGLRQP